MMTSANWPNPERPGVVMWPHKDGRHLFALGGGYIAAFWRADKQWLVCDDDHDLGFCASDRVKDLNYIGPCLTPTQIAEMLAGERERCAEICDAVATVALSDWKATAYDSDNRAGDAAEETAEICAQNIRNLGAAP